MIFAYLQISINSNFYLSTNASDVPMTILGYFFSEINCSSNDISFYKNWISSPASDTISNNAVSLEKEDNYIYIKDLFPLQEHQKEVFTINSKQFLHLLSDWQEKVCQYKPKEVTIIYKNDQFIIETKN